MMQALVIEGVVTFSHEILIEMYQKLDFSKRYKTLELFMAENRPLLGKNPPYSSLFSLTELDILPQFSPI